MNQTNQQVKPSTVGLHVRNDWLHKTKKIGKLFNPMKKADFSFVCGDTATTWWRMRSAIAVGE